MNAPQLLPWIGGATKEGAGERFTPLVSPVDETIACRILDGDESDVDAAVRDAHAAYLKHREATTAARVGWLEAAARAVDQAEDAIVCSLIRDIGKPRRALMEHQGDRRIDELHRAR